MSGTPNGMTRRRLCPSSGTARSVSRKEERTLDSGTTRRTPQRIFVRNLFQKEGASQWSVTYAD
ncbi:hypothetical protein GCM10022253_18960 [Sphingomonas endophytica]